MSAPGSLRHAGWKPRAVLLDFYGTVVEEDDEYIGQICQEVAVASPMQATTSQIASYWAATFREMCLRSFGSAYRTQRELEGASLRAVLRQYQANLSAETLSERLSAYWRHPALFPDSQEALERCAVPVCLVSNIDDEDIRAALGALDLSFEWVVTSQSSRAYKPREEMFNDALRLLGRRPDDVVHLGDSLTSDVHGARACGIRSVWVNRASRPLPVGSSQPDFEAASLLEALDVCGASCSVSP